MRNRKVTLISVIDPCGRWDVFELELSFPELFGLTDATSNAGFCPSRFDAARKKTQTMELAGIHVRIGLLRFGLGRSKEV
jgi:hypothetical protein